MSGTEAFPFIERNFRNASISTFFSSSPTTGILHFWNLAPTANHMKEKFRRQENILPMHYKYYPMLYYLCKTYKQVDNRHISNTPYLGRLKYLTARCALLPSPPFHAIPSTLYHGEHKLHMHQPRAIRQQQLSPASRIQLQLYRELKSRGVLYAWSPQFRHQLESLSQTHSDIVFEDFGKPTPIPNLAAPPIAVARYRPQATTPQAT